MAADPYRYFRLEAREIVSALQQGALDLEKGGSTIGTVKKLLRAAHTLKGAARVVRLPEIADLAHQIESVLEPHREASGPVGPGVVDELLQAADAIGARTAALDGPEREPGAEGGAAPAPRRDRVANERQEPAALEPLPGPRGDDRIEAVLVPIAALDGLLDTLVELRSSVHELEGDLAGAAPGRGQAAEGLKRRVAALHAELGELRLVPAGVLATGLERVTRDAALALGKRVDLQVRGGGVTLDASVLSAVQAAMLQLVKNAVAHGIEASAERGRLGKAPVGRIDVSVERRSARIAIACSDDGRGFDVDAIRRSALARGLIAPADAAAFDVGRAVELLLRGGITTAGAVTQVAGRGVGLDLVRDVIESVSGELAVETAPGRGTTITLTVPVSLAALESLAVEVAGERYLIPLDGVERVERFGVHEGDPVPNAVQLGDATVGFLPLATALGVEISTARAAWTAVVLSGGARPLALGVDRLLGTVSAIVRPPPEVVGRVPLVAGVAVEDHGAPVLVLDPSGLRELVHLPARPRVEPAVRWPVLIIDDSLTTRMLEQTILTAAGYEVDLATSAEEGIAKARTRRYGVFVVDVEMPGMNGFEFVAQTRADPELRVTPAILVTSRDAPEDRARGLQVGASAYIVKSEFDERRLLDLVARVMSEDL